MLAISVHLQTLDRWLRENVAHSDSPVILCDTQGFILAPSSAVAAGGGPGKARVAPALLATGAAGGAYAAADGREMLGASTPLGRDGWRLVSDLPVTHVLAGYRRQMRWVFFGAVATLLVVLPLVLRLSRNIERPLTGLAAYARELHDTRYAAACPVARSDGLPREVAELREAFCQMAGEIRSHVEEVERISVEDALTGLYNRRFLFSGGRKLLEASVRAQRPCACLMLDADHFKVVNDTYGHAAGDRVLAHLARILVGCVRKSDLAARYGGEEFAVLLTGATAAQAAALAARFRTVLAGNPCRIDGTFLSVTVSIGVAEARERVEYGENALEDMLARADKALYAAKAAGRDRVAVDGARA